MSERRWLFGKEELTLKQRLMKYTHCIKSGKVSKKARFSKKLRG